MERRGAREGGDDATTQKQGQKRPEGVFHFEMCNAQALTQSLTQDESELGAATTASWLLRSSLRYQIKRDAMPLLRGFDKGRESQKDPGKVLNW